MATQSQRENRFIIGAFIVFCVIVAFVLFCITGCKKEEQPSSSHSYIHVNVEFYKGKAIIDFPNHSIDGGTLSGRIMPYDATFDALYQIVGKDTTKISDIGDNGNVSGQVTIINDQITLLVLSRNYNGGLIGQVNP